MEYVVGTLFIIICVLLIVVVLLQKGRGGGLGAAFGGMGSSAFGTRIGDVFTWVTIVLVALFLLLAVGATLLFRPAPTQVARPIFDPPPEKAPPGEVYVTIASPTLDVDIYYTLDGSDPDKESTRYDAPVRVQPPATLKARAYRGREWQPSEIAEAYYGPPTEPKAPAGSQPAGQTRPAPPAGD